MVSTKPIESHEMTPTQSEESAPTAVPHSRLEEYERDSNSRPPYILTRTELKLLGIAGVGFFLDAYDLFIINPVSTMLQFRLYGGEAIPAGLQGVLKASANIGSVIGQFAFGYLADALGRKAIYGKELMLIIFATIMSLTVPTGQISANASIVYLTIFRIILGIGVGGDYPMSASVTSDRANLRKRGTMLAYIFANQGWGSLVGSIVTMVVLACYKHAMDGEGETSKVDGVWRIIVGVSLIPAFGTLYQRLTLPESTRYQRAQRDAEASDDDIAELKKKNAEDVSVREKPAPPSPSSNAPEHKEPAKPKKAHLMEFIEYMSEWRHAKVLIGTCTCWFLLDIAFYGINLNQNVVLQQIGFAGKTGTPWHKLFKIATGNLIVTALGFVPGYYFTVFFVEKLGRKKIQLGGFLLEAFFLAILAGKFHTLGTASFVVLFAFLQFFFNFGANATTYMYPAEVFPTKFRAFAHGMSAASGKAGAIISALAFNALSESVGTPVVLWIFFGCCLAGACFTLLLPEVMGRDPDVVYEEEMREKRRAHRQQ
ncbi:MFS general substrate transporter [Punctularia strigosozonata HHB-11173 SS5]|uniref:MFS general substrate transporter n=1 Tax=Punctularia strigosozonata (strain HHB-11173) TaxID=741275 RepID=UPI0004417720|nr:MFS general substrate transporter [Punctularia strigosozonata HHB-11173 SS5]EIN12160.1 MFS general substrate transporter [Punctularia strigosozonata HHB-11173 SS5]